MAEECILGCFQAAGCGAGMVMWVWCRVCGMVMWVCGVSGWYGCGCVVWLCGGGVEFVVWLCGCVV